MPFRNIGRRTTATSQHHHKRKGFSAGREAVPDHLRRDALRADPTRILARPAEKSSGDGPEHHHYICLLELARATTGRVRFQRPERHRGIHSYGPGRRPLPNFASRALRLLRVGPRRTAGLAFRRSNHRAARYRSQVSGARGALLDAGWPRACTAAIFARRTDHRRAGRKRIWLFRP